MASLMSNSSFGKIPSGTTANRPASPVVGDQYYNGTIGALEVYTSSGWKAITIASGETSGRPASPSNGQLYSNSDLQRVEVYTGATYGWQNIVAETPGVTGYTGSVLETNSTNTISIVGTNFATGAIATLIGTDGTEYIATNTTVNNLTSISATFGAISPDKEPYDIKVTNPSNLYGVYYDILTVNDKPIWSTAAGSLGSYALGSVSIQLAATDEENNSITYSIASGSLPTGLTLSSSGLISGTNSGTIGTTYNFTVSASDSSNTVVLRSFSIDVVATITGGTITTSGSYRIHTFTSNSSFITNHPSLSVEYLIVGGGGGGGSRYGGGGGAGGMLTNSTSISNGTYSIAVGAGGAGATMSGASSGGGGGSSGQNSSFNSIIAYGGGGGGSADDSTSGKNGGSGGGAFSGSIGLGTSGQGNNGGTGSGSGTYPYKCGGGGGAGAVGQNARTDLGYAGDGGVGLQSSITGTATYYAGGGGGGSHDPYAVKSVSLGGLGGGGNSGNYGVKNPGVAGTSNTGGGGGGASTNSSGDSNTTGGPGGSGIVIIRYLKSVVGA
jgi:hypothetical protein